MSPASAVMPVVFYARISADLRRDEHGVQDQHRLNRATAERYGWTVVHEFTDNDKSTAKAGVVRDEFEDMLRVLRAGKLTDGTPVRGALVAADDRLARRPGDYERFVEAITCPRCDAGDVGGHLADRPAAARPGHARATCRERLWASTVTHGQAP